MSELRKIYVVSGSHDGILAVCSNLTKVYEVAKDYINEDDMEDMSYSKLCDKFRAEEGYVYTECEATIYHKSESNNCNVQIVMKRLNGHSANNPNK